MDINKIPVESARKVQHPTCVCAYRTQVGYCHDQCYFLAYLQRQPKKKEVKHGSA